jgi:hypothetical protein
VVSVAIDPAAVSFLRSGDTSAATAFVNSFVTNAAALAGVSAHAVSIAFSINGGDPIPASAFTGSRAGRRQLQQFSSVVVVVTILLSNPSTATAAAVVSNFISLDTNSLSQALGVPVLSVSAILATISMYPPPPSQPPPVPFMERADPSQTGQALSSGDSGDKAFNVAFVIVFVGGSIVLILCLGAACCRKPQATRAKFTQVPSPAAVMYSSITPSLTSSNSRSVGVYQVR